MRREDKQLVIENKMIYDYYKERLCCAATSEFEWGMPNTCNRLYFERTLLYDGKASMLIPKGTDFWVSIGFIPDIRDRWGFDVYGDPTNIKGVGYNSQNIETDEWMILYDNNSKKSLMPYIDLFARLLWECHNTFRSNLRQQNTPYIVATTQNESLSVTNFFNRLFGFDPVIKLKNSSNIDESVKVFDLKKESIGNDLLDSLKTIWNIALSMLGITGETTKKERLIGDELALNRMQDTISMSSRLQNRMEFCNKMNEKYDLGLTVNVASQDVKFSPYADPYFDMDGDDNG